MLQSIEFYKSAAGMFRSDFMQDACLCKGMGQCLRGIKHSQRYLVGEHSSFWSSGEEDQNSLI